MTRRRGRSLTGEERALWRQVAETTRKRTATAIAPPPEPKAPSAISREDAAPPRREPLASLRPFGRAEPPVTLPAAPGPRPSGLDRRTEERLRKGKRTPDARIDLHGMTAVRAHAALSQFVRASRDAGHRCVLVITGKGAAGVPHAFGDESPGVLRREAPVWLSTPPLSHMVVNVSAAHPRHGGGGALYVYLKKKR